MIVKIIFLFLAGMLVLAMFGRLRYPGQKKIEAMKCPQCGRHKIGKGRCQCKRKG